MKKLFLSLYLTACFYPLLALTAVADDDHFFRRRGGGYGGGYGGGPMSDAEFASLAGVYAAAFVGIFAVLFLAHGLIAGLPFIALPALSGLAWVLFIPGVFIPVAFWFLLCSFALDGGFASGSNGLYASILFLTLVSILYHYLFYILLGIFSARAWGKILLRVYCALGLFALVLAVSNASPLPVLLVLIVCLGPAWLSRKAYEWRSAKLAARLAAKKAASKTR